MGKQGAGDKGTGNRGGMEGNRDRGGESCYLVTVPLGSD